jgi:hypothetical protein
MRPFTTDALRLAAEAFLEEYGSSELKRLRNMLEHSAEYIAEARTRRRSYIPYVLQPGEPIGFAAGSGDDETRLWVNVFGTSYRIDPILRRAKELHGPLRALPR